MNDVSSSDRFVKAAGKLIDYLEYYYDVGVDELKTVYQEQKVPICASILRRTLSPDTDHLAPMSATYLNMARRALMELDSIDAAASTQPPTGHRSARRRLAVAEVLRQAL